MAKDPCKRLLPSVQTIKKDKQKDASALALGPKYECDTIRLNGVYVRGSGAGTGGKAC